MRHVDVRGVLCLISTLLTRFRSFWFLEKRGVPFSSLALSFSTPENLTEDLLFEAQSVYFFTLVLMQWGYVICSDMHGLAIILTVDLSRNLLATRGRKLSILQHTPLQNLYILPAALMALSIAFFFSYVPPM